MKIEKIISVDHASRHVFVGLENGTIQEYILSEDLNILESVRVYLAHQASVVEMIYSPERRWILSIGADSTISWSDVSTGNKLGNFKTETLPKTMQVQ